MDSSLRYGGNSSSKMKSNGLTFHRQRRKNGFHNGMDVHKHLSAVPTDRHMPINGSKLMLPHNGLWYEQETTKPDYENGFRLDSDLNRNGVNGFRYENDLNRIGVNGFRYENNLNRNGVNGFRYENDLHRNGVVRNRENLLPLIADRKNHALERQKHMTEKQTLVREKQKNREKQTHSVQRHTLPWRKRLVRICCLRKNRRKRYRSIVTLYRKMPLKAISRLWGKFNELELPVFLRRPLIGLYIWMFGCNLGECEVEDLKQYKNLGEFFRRQLKPGCRPIDDDHVLCSPADGKILYYGKVENGILEQVKGVTYSLRGFLGPQTWHGAQANDINHMSDEEYQQQLGLKPDHDLFHCIIYLAPGDYHRFHSPTQWSVYHRRHFPGELLSVNPGVARWIQGLFNFNERAVYTGKWQHGFFSMCAVGATNVGSIKIYCDEDLQTNTRHRHPEGAYFDKTFPSPVEVAKGDMFGEFNLGSTLVLIFEAPKGFEFKITECQKLCYGSAIGTSP